MIEWLANWGEVFLPRMPLWETFLRATVLFLGLWILLRLVPRRQAGDTSLNDMLFIIILGGIAAEVMAKKADSIADFFLLTLIVIGWNYALDWLAYRSPTLRRLIENSATPLIEDGQIRKDNLRREMLSEEDLLAQLRLNDVQDVSEVKSAHLESTGTISVVKANTDDNGQPTSRTGSEMTPSPVQPPTQEEELQQFLAAAERLKQRIQWHEDQASALRQTLTKHGIGCSEPQPPRVLPRTEKHPVRGERGSDRLEI